MGTSSSKIDVTYAPEGSTQPTVGGVGVKVKLDDVEEAADSSSQINCKIWLVNTEDPNYVYPELYEDAVPGLLAKENFGIALSGGGMRAMTLAHGWLRGLYELGYLSKARYVCSNSGGSWLNAPLAYQNKTDIASFFGPYLPPERCTLVNLERIDEKNHFHFVKNRFLTATLKEFLASPLPATQDDDRDFWSRSVGECFFSAYNLDHDNELPRIEGSKTQSPIPEKIANNKYVRQVKYDPSRGTPFPIIVGGATIGGENMFATIEFTPLYHGIPTLAPAYTPTGDMIGKVGGCFIEPIGFSMKPSKKAWKEWCASAKQAMENPNATDVPSYDPKERALKVDIPPPDRIVSVSENAGISSSAVAQNLSKKRMQLPSPDALDLPDSPYYSPVGGTKTTLRYCDGGSVDNCAFLPLLRRKVRRIVAFLANNIPVTEDAYKNGVISLSGYAGFFGQAVVQDGLETNQHQYNSARQVFHKEKWFELLEGLRNNVRRGGPASHMMDLEVLENKICGVQGGFTVRVLFFLSHESTNWNNSIPSDLKKRIEKDRKENTSCLDRLLFSMGKDADLSKFPYVPIDNLEYTALLMNCMSQLATWGVMENKDNLKTLLEAPLT